MIKSLQREVRGARLPVLSVAEWASRGLVSASRRNNLWRSRANYYQHRAMFPLVAAAILILCAHSLLAGGISGRAISNGSFTKSGVVFDKSFTNPGPAQFVNSNYLIPADRGRQFGPNLFHSFSQFDLTSSDSATFTGPSNIQNILSRVTDGNPSSIDGTINSEIQGANLFFLNPAGVMFGQHAQINVSGSFAVSTANYVRFSDGVRFNTNANLGDNGRLTSAPVSAFGFLKSNPAPAPVNFQQSNLAMQPSTGFHVIAGDVTLDGAKLAAPSGAVTMFSTASPGDVRFNLAAPGSHYAKTNFNALGAVVLVNGSLLSIDGARGGKIVVRGDDLTIDNSAISSANSGSITGGDIAVDVDGDLSVINGGQITTSTSASGDGGQIDISARQVSVTAAGLSDNNLTVGLDIEYPSVGELVITLRNPNGRIAALLTAIGGSGHDIHTTLSDTATTPITEGTPPFLGTFRPQSPLSDLKIRNGTWELSIGSFNSSGTLENWALSFGGMTFTATNVPQPIERYSYTISTININLSVLAGSVISTETSGPANAGNIHLNARSAELGLGGKISSSPGEFASGNAGDIFIKSASSLLLDSATISTETLSPAGASVHINSGSVKLVSESNIRTNNGSVEIKTGDLSVIQSGITGTSVDIQAEGVVVRGGLRAVGIGGVVDFSLPFTTTHVNISAASILLDGGRPDVGFSKCIFVENGGIRVSAGDIKLINGAMISATSLFEQLEAGSIRVSADSLVINGIFSKVESILTGSGSGGGGDIAVDASKLKIVNGGAIDTSTNGLGDAGIINVTANSLSIRGTAVDDTGNLFRSRIASESLGGFSDPLGGAFVGSGNGGDINIAVTGELKMSAGAGITASSLSANSPEEPGQPFFPSFGDAGKVTITAGSVNLSSGSSISTFAKFFDAGSIKLSSAGIISLTGDSSIESSAAINGGNIKINTPILVSLIDSKIDAQAGDQGGNITIDPVALQLRNSTINASATGQGGQIDLFTSFLVGPVRRVAPDGSIFLAFNSSITATGGTSNGTVNIAAPELDLGAQLITLPASLVSAENQLRERCTSLLQGDFSSFISIGRGGTEPEPDELQSAF